MGRKKITEKDVAYNYVEEDKFFVINENDPDLHAVVISLPQPPPLHLIDGYGLHPDEQYFRYKETPKKLRALEKEAFEKCREDYDRNANKVVTWDRVIDKFWELFEGRRDDMPEEVQFIKNVYWWRTYGYWFFNDGKPTYLPPDYFDFINFWVMPDVRERGGRPEYRDKDRRKFLMWHYLERTQETFSELDENGEAVKVNGEYKMMDVGARTFYGGLEPKVRRSGATQQGCHKVKKGIETTFGAYGTIISMDGDNAEKHYYKKLIPAVERYPYYLMCKYDATVGAPPKQLRYRARATSFDVLSLGSMIDYTDSADERKNDGDKLFYSLMDEEGKSVRSDILERWNVNKLAQSTGGGSSIIGFSLHPSTVEQMDEGGIAYYKMAQLSDFYHRIPGKGQTHSGLGLVFFSGVDGLENFIDRHGMSVIDTPTERQRRLRSDALFAKMNIGAMDYLMKERESLLSKGTPEALESYRSLRRKMPIYYAECWLGTSGDMGFDLEKIDQRLIELRRKSNIIKGNFEWENGIVDGRVVFVPSENGKFEVCRLLPDTLSNKKTNQRVYVGKKRTWEWQHAPLFPERFTCGADPFRFENKQASQLRENKSRQSDGGLAVFWERDKSIDKDDDITKWISHKFVVSYRYRPSSTFEYNEDALKVCVYYGATLYPEINVEHTWEHFLDRGYGGYLQYDVDTATGKFKEKPGAYSLEKSKGALFSWIKDYILTRCHAEEFASFLQEVKDIQGPEQMTKFDRFTAHGLAGLGSLSKAGSMYYGKNKQDDMEGMSLRSMANFLSGRR